MVDARGTALQDWVTIWHSELAALAVDREQQEGVLRGIDAWGGMLAAVVAAAAVAGLDAAGRAGSDAAAGAAAVDAAPDARVLSLERRVAELEARLGRG